MMKQVNVKNDIRRSCLRFTQFLQLAILLPANISTSDKSCFNVVGQRSNNVDPTLKMKQNLTLYFKGCITLKYNVGARRWYDVKTTLHNVVTKLYQRCFNTALTFLKLDRNQSGYW